MAKVVVIGGGPSGMMAALTASKAHEVVLLEKNEKLGKKLYITGKGRCNITNAKDISEFFNYIPGNPNFLYSALYSYTNEDVMEFFKSHGVDLKVERGDRVFPVSDKSSDIISALSKELVRQGVEILYNSNVKRFKHSENRIHSAVLDNGREIKGDYFILCTGGLSYPQTGSTGHGYILAEALGHNIIEPMPSLVPINIEEDFVKELQGLSLKNVEFKIVDERNKTLYKDFGEMLFAHFGVTGPIVLSASRIVNHRKNLKAVINLKPALSPEELDKRILSDFNKFINKSFKNSLDELLPQKLIPIVISLSKIDPDKKVNLISKEERRSLVNLLQNFTLTVKGLRKIDEAIITAGGIDVKEIDPSTLRSKLVENLYFGGEVIDIDAYTGGFNVQIALSTGYLAGLKVGEI